MSSITASSIVVKRSAFTAGRVSLRAKSAAPVAMKPRGMTVMAYKVGIFIFLSHLVLLLFDFSLLFFIIQISVPHVCSCTWRWLSLR